MRWARGVAGLLGAGLLLLSACTGETPSGTDRTDPPQYSIWGDDVVPSTPASADDGPVTLGVEFSSDVAGTVTGVRFYRSDADGGPHRGQLWSKSGRLIATSAPAAAGDGAGWVTVTFKHPAAIRAGASYVAAYTAPRGHYAADQDALGPEDPAKARDLTAWQGVYTYGRGVPRRTWHDSNYYVDPVFRPDTGAVPSSPPPTSATPLPTEEPTSTARSAFPGPATTGVPEGTSLEPYRGPCRITEPGTVIEARTIECDLTIEAPGVVISSSVLNGSVANAEDSEGLGFTIEDSEVRLGDRPGTGIGAADFTALRVEVSGGNRSIQCWRHCTVRDSWVHGQFADESGVAHESGIRMGSDSTIVHNAIGCDAPTIPPDAGCSADLTGYGDFGVVQRNLVQDNLFLATTGGTCAYGGSSQGKPFSEGVNNIRFIGNVFQRGARGTCGFYAPVMDFDPAAPGNEWSDNRWGDGDAFPAP